MYEEETHFRKSLLKQSETVLTHSTRGPLTQWPQNQLGSSAARDGCVEQVWGR